MRGESLFKAVTFGKFSEFIVKFHITVLDQ